MAITIVTTEDKWLPKWMCEWVIAMSITVVSLLQVQTIQIILLLLASWSFMLLNKF